MSSRGELQTGCGADLVVPRAAVGRLGLYLRQLERFLADGVSLITVDLAIQLESLAYQVQSADSGPLVTADA